MEIEIIGLFPTDLEQKNVLELIRSSFHLNESEHGYEIQRLFIVRPMSR